MKLILKNSRKLSDKEIREAVTKMIARKGYQVSKKKGKHSYSVENLEIKDQQTLIRDLVLKWCDRNDVECSIQ